jgi:antitoxin (DNA-binding transcriptional repressor) of toxin-antitoxin stability system
VIVTATEMANEGKRILDQVIQTGETVEIQRHGRTIASLNPHIGATRSELLRLLSGRGFSEKDSQQLRQAMEDVSEVIGYAGGN